MLEISFLTTIVASLLQTVIFFFEIKFVHYALPLIFDKVTVVTGRPGQINYIR